MCQSYLEIKCAGDQKFRRSNVPEITCSGDQMFRRSKIPEIEYSGDQMCQVLMEIINSRRSSVFGDQVCVSQITMLLKNLGDFMDKIIEIVEFIKVIEVVNISQLIIVLISC